MTQIGRSCALCYGPWHGLHAWTYDRQWTGSLYFPSPTTWSNIMWFWTAAAQWARCCTNTWKVKTECSGKPISASGWAMIDQAETDGLHQGLCMMEHQFPNSKLLQASHLLKAASFMLGTGWCWALPMVGLYMWTSYHFLVAYPSGLKHLSKSVSLGANFRNHPTSVRSFSWDLGQRCLPYLGHIPYPEDSLERMGVHLEACFWGRTSGIPTQPPWIDLLWFSHNYCCFLYLCLVFYHSLWTTWWSCLPQWAPLQRVASSAGQLCAWVVREV